eukprot:gene15503-18365_t
MEDDNIVETPKPTDVVVDVKEEKRLAKERAKQNAAILVKEKKRLAKLRAKERGKPDLIGVNSAGPDSLNSSAIGLEDNAKADAEHLNWGQEPQGLARRIATVEVDEVLSPSFEAALQVERAATSLTQHAREAAEVLGDFSGEDNEHSSPNPDASGSLHLSSSLDESDIARSSASNLDPLPPGRGLSVRFQLSEDDVSDAEDEDGFSSTSFNSDLLFQPSDDIYTSHGVTYHEKQWMEDSGHARKILLGKGYGAGDNVSRTTDHAGASHLFREAEIMQKQKHIDTKNDELRERIKTIKNTSSNFTGATVTHKEGKPMAVSKGEASSAIKRVTKVPENHLPIWRTKSEGYKAGPADACVNRLRDADRIHRGYKAGPADACVNRLRDADRIHRENDRLLHNLIHMKPKGVYTGARPSSARAAPKETSAAINRRDDELLWKKEFEWGQPVPHHLVQ